MNCVAVTDEVLAHWETNKIVVLLMAPTTDWEMAAANVRRDEPSQPGQQSVRVAMSSLFLLTKACSKQGTFTLPSFVSHMPKPVIFSNLCERLVAAVLKAGSPAGST